MKMTSLFAASSLCAATLPSPVMAHDHDANVRLDTVSHLFKAADVVAAPTLVDCTLSGGTKTRCFRITVRPLPRHRTPGPWCPTKATDGPAQSGIWIDPTAKKGSVFDADGPFMSNLATFYDDPEWQLVDPETGNVRVTRTREACAAAARPDVDPQYRNHCVQCLPDYMAPDHSVTYTLPLAPVMLKPGALDTLFGRRPSESVRGGVGVALDGVKLDGPAPVDAILGAHTIAPFDDCGGHVNLHDGYHYHAVTDCTGASQPTGDRTATVDAPVVGIAMDGHLILAGQRADGTVPKDLDACNGHGSGRDYHYHAGAPGSNAILPCLAAERGCASTDPDEACDATRKRRRP